MAGLPDSFCADPRPERGIAAKISARNQLKGTVVAIEPGAVNGIVKLDIGGGNVVVSSITMASIEALDLAVGKTAYAVIKASNVMMAVDD